MSNMNSNERQNLLTEACLAISANDTESLAWAHQIIQSLVPLAKAENEMVQEAKNEQRGYDPSDLSSL